MKFLNFFLILWAIFVLLDPDSEYGSGSATLVACPSERTFSFDNYFPSLCVTADLMEANILLKSYLDSLRNAHLSTLIRYSRVPIKSFVYLATIPMFQIPIKRTKHFELGGEKKRKGQMIQF